MIILVLNQIFPTYILILNIPIINILFSELYYEDFYNKLHYNTKIETMQQKYYDDTSKAHKFDISNSYNVPNCNM